MMIRLLFLILRLVLLERRGQQEAQRDQLDQRGLMDRLDQRGRQGHLERRGSLGPLEYKGHRD